MPTKKEDIKTLYNCPSTGSAQGNLYSSSFSQFSKQNKWHIICIPCVRCSIESAQHLFQLSTWSCPHYNLQTCVRMSRKTTHSIPWLTCTTAFFKARVRTRMQQSAKCGRHTKNITVIIPNYVHEMTAILEPYCLGVLLQLIVFLRSCFSTTMVMCLHGTLAWFRNFEIMHV